MKVLKEVVVESRDVSCSGDDEGTGHPKVFLRISKKNKNIICPYCSKNFILK